MIKLSGYQIIVLPASEVASISTDLRKPLVLFLTREGATERIVPEDPKQAIHTISRLAAAPGILHLAFISPDDHFELAELKKSINHFYQHTPERGIALLIPYKTPPIGIPSENPDAPNTSKREDGAVQSFLISPKHFSNAEMVSSFMDWSRLAFRLVHAYLNSSHSNNMEVLQVGKPSETYVQPGAADEELLQQSLMIIPHKDSLSLLYRCFLHLNSNAWLPGSINLCFDDSGYHTLNTRPYEQLKERLRIFKNIPYNVGPYPPRHYSILAAKQEYIFFQDSDDIPVATRFVHQLRALRERNLDMVGSHELRIDEFKQSLLIMRYPLDVTASLNARCFHPLFHPTALITRKAYLKTGGFSTNLRFVYDTQFLLRSHFFLRSGNVDEFLYLRFKRPNSLTTDPKTSLGSGFRSFLIGRWNIDFRLIKEDKLHLQDSSLSVQKHKFDYLLAQLV